MNHRHLLTSLLLALPAAAQEPEAPQAPPVAAKRVDEPLVTLSFAGGTFADLVAQIRRLEPRANIVVAPGAGEVPVPAMELRAVALDQAFETACMVATGPRQVRVRELRGQGATIYTLLAGPLPKVEPKETAPRTEVFGLRRLTEPVDAAAIAATTILSAVEAAVHEPPLADLRYHEESRLMIVRGTAEQLRLVESVLQNLERDVQEQRPRAQREAQPARGEPKK